MRVNEVYLSIQGEGPDVGVPMVFLRLQGCNIACIWCDTKYSWRFEGEELGIDAVLSRITELDKFPAKRVYITGGEPLVQAKELGLLVQKLRAHGYVITIATNGTLPVPVWGQEVLWDVDIKCPSAGVKTPLLQWSWVTIGEKNSLKFVVADENDLDFVLGVVPTLTGPLCPTLLVSPMIPVAPLEATCWRLLGREPENWLQRVAEFAIQNNLRYSLQIHKVIWGNKRGV